MFRMSTQLKYIIVLLFMVTLAAAQTANAQSITVDLAEKTPPVDLVEGLDPGDPTMTGLPPTTTTTTSTTTTTTTLPTIPRCPDGIAGATAGSQDGYDYWAFDDVKVCNDLSYGGGLNVKIYCFENPYVDVKRKHLMEWESLTAPGVMAGDGDISWDVFAAEYTGQAVDHPETCFICACFRLEGCFAPGVKITMADGSLRNIEDVRAGDSVRNAKTGVPVKVAQVIEGPEALPLIRFGFDGTTVTTSQAHPVLTAAGLKPAHEVRKGDTVFDAQGHPHALTILETLPLEEGQRVINVNLDAASSDADERLIVSDGIITGDIVLQGLLKERK